MYPVSGLGTGLVLQLLQLHCLCTSLQLWLGAVSIACVLGLIPKMKPKKNHESWMSVQDGLHTCIAGYVCKKNK
jgi:hypothetical protein